MGYEAYREGVLERQKALGLIAADTELTPIDPYAETTSHDGKPWSANDRVLPWATLSDDERRLFSRMAEVYAGFLSHADHELGRLLDHLEAIGELDNTIVVVVSDNGASGEGGPNGSVNENKFFNGIPDSIEENLKLLDELGSTKTYNHYPTGWAWAFNTPFKLWKRYANFEGGTADPLIVAWPKGFKAAGEYRRQYTHAIDIVPTLYECLGVELPEVVNGYTQSQLDGVSFRSTFDDDDAETGKETQFYSMLGTRAIWHRGWKAATAVPAAPESWGDFNQQRWELYDTKTDPERGPRPRRAAPGKAPGPHRPLVGGGRRQPGAAARVARRDRDPGDCATGALEPEDTLRLLPGRRGDPRVDGPEHPQPLVHHRRRGRHRVPGGERRALLAGVALRRACAVRQGWSADVRLQLRRRASPGDPGDGAGPDRPPRPLGELRAARTRACPPRAR